MKNIIGNNYSNIIVFDENTMDAKLYKNEEDYPVDTTERVIKFIDIKKVPRIIANIVIDEISEEKIVIRNKNIRLKADKAYGYYTTEKWIEVEEYKQKNDRVMTIDLINKQMSVKAGKKEEILDFKNGISYDVVNNLVRTFFMKFVSAVVVPEQDDFFKPFREMFSKSNQYSFILKLKDDGYGLSRYQIKEKISCGFDISECILKKMDYKFYKVNEATNIFCKQLSSVIYMINNPGIESFMNSPYKNNLYSEIFLYNKIFTNSKLNDVLSIKKTSLKMMNTIVGKIAQNVSLLGSGSNCDKNKIQKTVSDLLYRNKETIDKCIDIIKGYNNLEYLLDCYFDNQFYLDYFAALKKKYYLVRLDSETGAQKQFENAIYNVVNEICEILQAINSVLSLAPEYLNNINHLCEYITNIGRKQGYQNIHNGIYYLEDYIKMQKHMNSKYEKYPKSITLVHDIAANNLRFFNDESYFKEHCGGFVKAVANYVKLDYINRNEEFIAIHPNGFEDLFVEGCSLNHCVASYIPEVAANRSKIMFIRKKEEKNVPYFTVEIKGNTIRQVKGLNQVNPTDKKLLDFISTWSEKRDLYQNYM